MESHTKVFFCILQSHINGMSKKIYITEQQFRQLLNEKLGIAKHVVEISTQIEKYVYEFLDENINNKLFTINDELNVNLKKLFYNSIEDFYSDYEKDTTIYKNGYSFNDKTIYLTFLIINNVLSYNDNIENTIQHEVEHYYQCVNSGKSFSTPQYQEISTLMTSSNPYISVISKLLYYSKKFEIDAQINGAYNEIKNNHNIISPDDIFKTTELGLLKKILFDIKTAIESWNYESYSVLYALNTININEKIRNNKNKPYNKKKLVNIINNTIDYFFRKCAKLMSLHIENIKEKNLNNIKKDLNNNNIHITEN